MRKAIADDLLYDEHLDTVATRLSEQDEPYGCERRLRGLKLCYKAILGVNFAGLILACLMEATIPKPTPEELARRIEELKAKLTVSSGQRLSHYRRAS